MTKVVEHGRWWIATKPYGALVCTMVSHIAKVDCKDSGASGVMVMSCNSSSAEALELVVSRQITSW